MRRAASLRLLALGVVLAGLLAAGAARSQDADAEYQASWLEAQSALAAFANAQLAQGRKQLERGQLQAAYRRESERYAKALARLGARLPPPEAAPMHWRLLPLHERALSAMKLALGAMERGDEAAQAAAWASLRGTVEALKRALQERL